MHAERGLDRRFQARSVRGRRGRLGELVEHGLAGDGVPVADEPRAVPPGDERAGDVASRIQRDFGVMDSCQLRLELALRAEIN